MVEPKNEAEVEQQIKIEAVQYGCILMRNNNGALNDETGRPVRYGLGNDSKAKNDKIKSSDEIGFTRIKISQAMVGRTVAIFTAIEVKHPTKWEPSTTDPREKAQDAFLTWISKNGGIAGMVNSVEGFKAVLRNWGINL